MAWQQQSGGYPYPQQGNLNYFLLMHSIVPDYVVEMKCPKMGTLYLSQSMKIVENVRLQMK